MLPLIQSGGGGGATTATLTQNAQSGTSYAILNGDLGKLITFNNAAQIAATIAQAGTAGSFAAGWFCYFKNIGTGTVVLTPATSTIDGFKKLVIPPNASGQLWTDGTNYKLINGSGANIGSGDSGLISLYDPLLPGLAVVLNNNWSTITGTNLIRCFKFNLPDFKGFGRATVNRGTTVATGKNMYAGMYDSAKNLLFQTTAFDMGTSGLLTVTLATTWLLMPGDYYFTVGADATTVNSLLIYTGGIDSTMLGNAGTVVQKAGPSPNVIAAGVLPATLGTLGALGSNNTVPGVYWEV